MSLFLCLWISLCSSPGAKERILSCAGTVHNLGVHVSHAAGKMLTPFIKEGMTRGQIERFLGASRPTAGGLLSPELYEPWGIVVKYDVEIDDASPDPMLWKARWYVRRAYHLSDSECPIRVYRTRAKGSRSGIE